MYVFISGSVATPEKPDGLYVGEFDEASGRLRIVKSVPALPKTAYLVPDARRGKLYAVGAEEGNIGFALSYSFDSVSGALTLLDKRSTLGLNPNYASLSKTGSSLFFVNFSGGSLGLAPIGEDGRIGEAGGMVCHEGSGPLQGAQDSPHPHCMESDPSGDHAWVTDLGTDTLYLYRIDEARKKLQLSGTMAAAPGSGPRHLLFHTSKPIVYVINELNATIDVYAYSALPERGPAMERIQTVPTLPAEYTDRNKCADLRLHPSGKFLYGSNRGHDSIASYAVGADGTLICTGFTPSLGRNPRSIAISPSGTHMLVANEGSGHMAVFRINEETGGLSEAGQYGLDLNPICIKFYAEPLS